jgi:hypothetical protein
MVQEDAPISRVVLRRGADGTLNLREGTPLLLLADTAWNGLVRSTPGDWREYLQRRAEQGFNAVLTVLGTPWRACAGDARGETALRAGRVHEAYFDRLEEKFAAAEHAGITLLPVLLWACTPTDLGQTLDEDTAIALGRHAVQRYRRYQVIWLLGGDGNYAGQAGRWGRIGRAVFGTGGEGPLAGMHHGGLMWPEDPLLAEPWYSLAGVQSGHGDAEADLRWLTQTAPQRAANLRGKALANLEPNYEHHPAYHSKMMFSARQVRRAAWWSMLGLPATGVGYGHNSIWNWNVVPEPACGHESITREVGPLPPWRMALDLPGAQGMGILRRFLETLRWWELMPAGPQQMQQTSTDPGRYIATALSDSERLAVIYKPALAGLQLGAAALELYPRMQWFDPARGEYRDPVRTEISPMAPDQEDWVLVLRGE